jgi:hypothetical protein
MKKIVVSGMLAAWVLSACGGGGGSDDGKAANNAVVPPPAESNFDAQGMYTGTDSNNDMVSGVVLDDGTYYFVHVNPATNALGLLQGKATASNGAFNSTDALDYLTNSSFATHGSVTASYVPRANLNGTFASSVTGNTSFTTAYSTVYDQTPSLSAIAGTYTGAAATFRGSATVTFAIGADGAVTGSWPSDCTFSGTVKIHGTKNVYDTAIVFGPHCPNPGETFTGVVSVNGNALTVASIHPDRSEAFVVAATK